MEKACIAATVDFPRPFRRDPTTCRMLPNAAEASPRCQRVLTQYRFTTGDDLPIITYHCAEHGDVIPMYGIIMNHNEEKKPWK